MEYEAVIGLEVHVQLKTRTKLFSRVGAGYGSEPNTLVDPFVLGLPGALPVLNREAVKKTIQVGLLFGCKIADRCKWDRKNYFYPDNPTNFQISQFDQPLCEGGEVEIELPGPSRNIMGTHRKVKLTRIHLEEDVGKLNHFSEDSLIDFNRADTPLIEIVTDPNLYSADEVFAFLTSLRQSLIYAGISDCDMEKGQLRCDANVSIRPTGSQKLGTKVEIKNMNSISGIRNGVIYEIARQIKAVQAGQTIHEETRRWDAEGGYTESMRLKGEFAHDYRCFPDPDLVPVEVSKEMLEEQKKLVPELPFDKQRRFFEEYKLPYTLTSVLVPSRELSDFFEAAAKLCKKPQAAANWIANDLLRELSAAEAEGALPLSESKVKPEHIASLVTLVEDGIISNNIAKEVFIDMFASGDQPESIVDRKGLRQSNDTGELEIWAKEAIEASPKSVEDWKAGKENAINYLKGQVMKASRGKANPKLVDEVLRKQLDAL